MASLIKNTASQNMTFLLVNASTGAALTGASVTVKVTKDGIQGAGGGSVIEMGSGQYNYAPSQADTNAADCGFLFTAASAVPVNLDFHTDLAAQTGDAYAQLNILIAHAFTYDGNNLPITDVGDWLGVGVNSSEDNLPLVSVATFYDLNTANEAVLNISTPVANFGVSIGAFVGQINGILSADSLGRINLGYIEDQAVTCAAPVTMGAFVGNATHAIVVDSSGRVNLIDSPNATAMQAFADAALIRDWTATITAVGQPASRSSMNALRKLRNHIDTTTLAGSLSIMEEDDSTIAYQQVIIVSATAELMTSVG